MDLQVQADDLGRLVGSGSEEVVPAGVQPAQVDVFGQDLPVAVTTRGVVRDRVVGGNHNGDRSGQLSFRRAGQGVGEIVVRCQAVVPICGTDLLGACGIQFVELGVASVPAECCGYLGIA